MSSGLFLALLLTNLHFPPHSCCEWPLLTRPLLLLGSRQETAGKPGTCLRGTQPHLGPVLGPTNPSTQPPPTPVLGSTYPSSWPHLPQFSAPATPVLGPHLPQYSAAPTPSTWPHVPPVLSPHPPPVNFSTPGRKWVTLSTYSIQYTPILFHYTGLF